MHPWKKIIRGGSDEVETKTCFMGLERLACPDGDMENLRLHLTKTHSIRDHLRELMKMCIEAEEKEEEEGWNIEGILKEMRQASETKARKKLGLVGLMEMLWKTGENNQENEVNCFLCLKKLIVKESQYINHLENQHGTIFGVKEIIKSGEIIEESREKTGGKELEKPRTDAETVKELVEMKFLSEKRRMRLQKTGQKIFSRKYQVLSEEANESC